MIQPTLEFVEQLAAQLTKRDRLELIERIAKQERAEIAEPSKPQSLYGVWRGAFPKDCDVEDALKDARTGWLKDLEDGEGK